MCLGHTCLKITGLENVAAIHSLHWLHWELIVLLEWIWIVVTCSPLSWIFISSYEFSQNEAEYVNRLAFVSSSTQVEFIVVDINADNAC